MKCSCDLSIDQAQLYGPKKGQNSLFWAFKNPYFELF